MSNMLIRARNLPGAITLGALLAVSSYAHAQTGGGGQGGASTPGAQASPPASAQPASPPGAQPPSPAGTQPPSPPGAQAPSPPSGNGDTRADTPTQPAYPSSTPPRGTTPQQRQQLEEQGAIGTGAEATRCNQQNELARNECLRRDMTDDEDRPAGVTRSMQQRRQQQMQRAQRAAPEPSTSADPRSDEAGARSRTRTASSSTPPQPQAEPEQQTDAQRETSSDANNASDTLGGER